MPSARQCLTRRGRMNRPDSSPATPDNRHWPKRRTLCRERSVHLLNSTQVFSNYATVSRSPIYLSGLLTSILRHNVCPQRTFFVLITNAQRKQAVQPVPCHSHLWFLPWGPGVKRLSLEQPDTPPQPELQPRQLHCRLACVRYCYQQVVVTDSEPSNSLYTQAASLA